MNSTRLVFAAALALSLSGCFDIVEDAPPAQCDPERRCTFIDAPVCGEDGTVYECESVARCFGVAVATDPERCGSLPHPDIGGEDVDTPDGSRVCGQPSCAADCPNGFRYDDDGCMTCDCVEDTCFEADWGCPESCEAGTDESGCPTCSCPTCEPVDHASCTATPGCQVVTTEGCESCECVEDRCSREFCAEWCPSGYVIEDGCPTCRCHEPCNDLPECDLFCEFGNQVDPRTGCVLSCACREATCNVPLCALACQHGYRHDASGCETCDCRGEPCASNEDCALDHRCVPDPWAPFDGPESNGECVQLAQCDPAFGCPEAPCGFYFRSDCCPPLTTCTDNLPSCPAVCLD